jgi:23S rRNA (guanosine2251-2'-O)-methyltransferase
MTGRGGGGRSASGGGKGGGRGREAARGSAGSTGRGSAGRAGGGRSGGAPGAGSARVGGGRSGQLRPLARSGAPRTAGGADRTGRSRRRPHAADAPDGVVTVEGRQAVRELLRARRRAVHELLVAETVDRSGPVGEILDLAAGSGIPVRRVGRSQLDARAATDAPQGVLAVADPVPDHELAELLGATRSGTAPFLVVLDGVTDPHNLGAVMRSALSAGATGVVVGRHRAASVGAVATKAAAGAVEWLPVAVVTGIPAALAELAAAGVWTVGLDAGATTPVWDLAVATEAVAIVLGAEGSGLSRLARQRCDVVASVPMQGPLASLNVSAAATLACFEVARRRLAHAAGA